MPKNGRRTLFPKMVIIYLLISQIYFHQRPKLNALLIEVLEGPEDESVPQDVADIDVSILLF